MEEVIYLNGSLLPRSQARISPFDHGFLYGYGLYETMRAYSGHIFRLNQHLTRLTRSTEVLGLALGMTEYDLERAVYQTIEANGLKDARVRLAVSAGEGDMIPDPRTCTSPTVLVMVKVLVPQPTEVYERGFKGMISQIRQNSQSPLHRIKSSNHLAHILVKSEARTAGMDDALLLNERGFLAEASSSNIFMVSQGTLFTPTLDTGALGGITRQAVLELAPSLGIKAKEEEGLHVEALLQADEAFLTNSIMEIMPLTEVNGQSIGLRQPGSLTQSLMAAYKDLVKRETTGPISL